MSGKGSPFFPGQEYSLYVRKCTPGYSQDNLPCKSSGQHWDVGQTVEVKQPER